MSDFRRITDDFYASPQVSAGDMAEAAALGVTLVVNNRPDGESDDQPAGADIEAAVRAAGMDYLAIPVTHAGFSLPQVDALAEALAANEGKVLGFCRSGTRSTLLWAMAAAKRGGDPAAIAAAAERGGYSIAPVRPTVDMLAGQASG